MIDQSENLYLCAAIVFAKDCIFGGCSNHSMQDLCKVSLQFIERPFDKGVIEAAVATGASMPLIIRKVLFVEATPALVRALTVTFVSVIGYSAMAGAVGGGGSGNLAIMYGYNRYQTGVLLVTVVALVIIVQVGQWIGDKIAIEAYKKNKISQNIKQK